MSDRRPTIQFRLHAAARSGNLDRVIQLVQEEGEKANLKDLAEGATPLHCAALKGHRHVVQWLVRNANADINARANNGSTPMHSAAESGDVEMVSWMINEGHADCEAKTNNGTTPLHSAAFYGHLGVLQCLINVGGGNANITDSDGATPVHSAAFNGHLNCVRWLVTEAGADADLKACVDDSTPLHSAARQGHHDVVNFLLDHGVDGTLATTNGYTSLHWAAYHGHMDIVRTLVKRTTTEVESPANNGTTPLHCAAFNGHTDIVEWMVTELNCDPDIEDNFGATPVHSSSWSGHLDTLQWLVTQGHADPNHVGIDGSTPLHSARDQHHPEVAAWLESFLSGAPATVAAPSSTPAATSAVVTPSSDADLPTDPFGEGDNDTVEACLRALTGQRNLQRGVLGRAATAHDAQTALLTDLEEKLEAKVAELAVGPRRLGSDEFTSLLQQVNSANTQARVVRFALIHSTTLLQVAALTPVALDYFHAFQLQFTASIEAVHAVAGGLDWMAAHMPGADDTLNYVVTTFRQRTNQASLLSEAFDIGYIDLLDTPAGLLGWFKAGQRRDVSMKIAEILAAQLAVAKAASLSNGDSWVGTLDADASPAQLSDNHSPACVQAADDARALVTTLLQRTLNHGKVSAIALGDTEGIMNFCAMCYKSIVGSPFVAPEVGTPVVHAQPATATAVAVPQPPPPAHDGKPHPATAGTDEHKGDDFDSTKFDFEGVVVSIMELADSVWGSQAHTVTPASLSARLQGARRPPPPTVRGQSAWSTVQHFGLDNEVEKADLIAVLRRL